MKADSSAHPAIRYWNCSRCNSLGTRSTLPTSAGNREICREPLGGSIVAPDHTSELLSDFVCHVSVDVGPPLLNQRFKGGTQGGTPLRARCQGRPAASTERRWWAREGGLPTKALWGRSRPAVAPTALWRAIFARQRAKDGGPDRDRTGDLMNAIHARSQLRYWPTLGC